MSDNITPIKPTKPENDSNKIWCCAYCDSTAFELFGDGTTGCRGCGYRGEYPGGRWGEWMPLDDQEPKVKRSTTLFDGAEFAQKAIVKSIDEDAAMLIVAWPNGKLRTWSQYDGMSTEGEKSTVRYLAAQAVSMILGEPPLDPPDATG
jgi:hypothetical protein